MGMFSHDLLASKRLRLGRGWCSTTFLGRFRANSKCMAKSIRAYTKIRRSEQVGVNIGVRLQPEALAQLDNWIASRPPPGTITP